MRRLSGRELTAEACRISRKKCCTDTTISYNSLSSRPKYCTAIFPTQPKNARGKTTFVALFFITTILSISRLFYAKVEILSNDSAKKKLKNFLYGYKANLYLTLVFRLPRALYAPALCRKKTFLPATIQVRLSGKGHTIWQKVPVTQLFARAKNALFRVQKMLNKSAGNVLIKAQKRPLLKEVFIFIY